MDGKVIAMEALENGEGKVTIVFDVDEILIKFDGMIDSRTIDVLKDNLNEYLKEFGKDKFKYKYYI